MSEPFELYPQPKLDESAVRIWNLCTWYKMDAEIKILLTRRKEKEEDGKPEPADNRTTCPT